MVAVRYYPLVQLTKVDAECYIREPFLFRAHTASDKKANRDF